MFSPNTSSSNRSLAYERLQVNEVQEPGKYFGLPMSLGKKKAFVFHFIIVRIRQKLQGWSSKVLSKSGKVILLKTAVQVIPNFWMDLFLIPIDVCNGIKKQMNGFWWQCIR